MFHCLIIKDLCCSLDQQLVYFIKLICICQELFSTFFKVERRRRDLNPRAAINDLLPFQGSPFSHLGTSPAEFIKCIQFIELLLETEKVGFEPTAPFGVTGFQDRLLKPLGHLSIC